MENGRQQMFLGFPARAAEPYWTLPHLLPNAARDNLGLQPGLAQEGDKGVAAKAWVQMEPLLGLENSTPAQKQFCLTPPAPEPSRALNPQPFRVHWTRARNGRESLVSSYFIDEETETQDGYKAARESNKRGLVSPSSLASLCTQGHRCPRQAWTCSRPCHLA